MIHKFQVYRRWIVSGVPVLSHVSVNRRRPTADARKMTKKQPSHPRDAIEATSRLSAVLETIRAASPNWHLEMEKLPDLGRAIEADPAMASIVAAYLKYQTDSVADVSSDLATLKSQIDSMIDSVRGY